MNEISNYWQERKKNLSGRPKKIKTPKVLWGYFCDYCERVQTNPFKKQDFIRGGELAGQIVELDTIRPLTWQGFEDYLFEKKVIVRLDDYKSNKEGRYADFADIITRIGNAIYSNKFEGAAVGAFNSNIIARDLGLVDKQSQDIKVEQPLFGNEKPEGK